MGRPIKVLYFVDRMLRGGIQSLVVDWVSRFDKNKINVDFLLLDDGKEYELEDTLKGFGCKVYKLKGIWINSPIDFIRQAKALDNFFKEHNDYLVIHLHSSSKNYLVLKYAKKYKIPVRIAHSHNIGFQTQNPTKKIIGNILKAKLIKYSTDFFACSKLAGKWLFGKKIINSDKFKVIHNAIDYDRFKFNPLKRKEIRNKLGLKNNDILIGHVGRFTNQKNHTFLIDIFAELHKKNRNYKLLLIGTGILEKKIITKVERLNLDSYTFFEGFKNNANEYMQAMDLFILPSLYEGLGLALIEAQASGINCFYSEGVVPEEARVLETSKPISLNKNAKEWAEIINNTQLDRNTNTEDIIRESGYLISEVIEFLQQFYERGIL